MSQTIHDRYMALLKERNQNFCPECKRRLYPRPEWGCMPTLDYDLFTGFQPCCFKALNNAIGQLAQQGGQL